MEEMNYKNTEEGTPQGGIISPMLCNIALNGLEKLIKSIIPKRKGIGGGVHVIRYADDIIILGKSKDILLTIKKGLNEFLNERGLKLNDKKTSIIHIKTGFDFLGFNIRRMKYNPKFNKQTTQETVLVIKPSKKGVQRLKDNIRSIIDKNKPIEALIRDLNPILRG
jgi:Retron-type reverse transcriptase